MKALALLALVGVGVAAIWKHHLTATGVKSTADIPSGVSVYASTPAPSSPQQLMAAQLTNSDAVSEPGFAGAFGPDENQPGDGEELW